MKQTEPVLIVLFGATGDLAQRKLYPALFELYRKGYLHPNFAVIGTARRPWTDDYYRQVVAESVSADNGNLPATSDFSEHFYYQSHNVTDTDHYRILRERMNQISSIHGTKGNQLFYLSIAPGFFKTVTEHLKNANLIYTDGFNRVIIEKPFGTHLKDSKMLNDAILKAFPEEAIYRIDHYLGKPFMSSILELRQNNPIFEQIWNHTCIDNIQITLSENLKVETRGDYYDQTGALRDMFQSHILQIMSFILMDLPENDNHMTLIHEKNKALQQLMIDSKSLAKQFVRGQYVEEVDFGQLKSYRDEENVDANSLTETFVAGYLFSNQSRWENMPIYFRTGKALDKKETRIDIIFKHQGQKINTLRIAETDNLWTLQINDEEKISEIPLKTIDPSETMGDYELLIFEALIGRKKYFVHWTELETSWKIVDQIRKIWLAEKNLPLQYWVGSHGPDAMYQLTRVNGDRWID